MVCILKILFLILCDRFNLNINLLVVLCVKLILGYLNKIVVIYKWILCLELVLLLGYFIMFFYIF